MTRAHAVGFGVLLSLSLVARASQAADGDGDGDRDDAAFPRGPGAEIALRAGPSFVAGDAERGFPLADQVGAPPMFAIDGGYRLNERFYIGAVSATGIGVIAQTPCKPTYRCPGPAFLTELGGVVRYHLPRMDRFDPWLGAGLAFAVQGSNAKRTEIEPGRSGFCLLGCGPTRIDLVEQTLRYGLDGLLEGGIDWRASRRIALGLTVSAFAGKYLGVDIEEKRNGEEIASGGRPAGGGLHLWVIAAARVVFDFESPRAPRE